MNKLTLKLCIGSTTKRLREIPETYEALLNKLEQVVPAIKTNDFQIIYADETGDNIDVLDDDDLQSAYEVATEALKGQLKLQVKIGDGSNQSQFIVSDALNQSMKANIVEDFQSQCKIEEAPATDVNVEEVKQAIQEVADKQDDEDSSSDSDEPSAKKCKKKGGKKKFGGMPKKAFKKMVRKEIEKQSAELGQAVSSTEATEADDQIPTGAPVNQAVHTGVACDGCDANPIVGPRYKCSVRKNFDFCQRCEEKIPHEHAFLKINKPEQAPTSIFTVVDETAKNVNPDVDINLNSEMMQGVANMAQNFMRGMGGMRGMRGMRGMGGCGRGGRGGRGMGMGGRGGRGGCHGMGRWAHMANEWAKKMEEGCQDQDKCWKGWGEGQGKTWGGWGEGQGRGQGQGCGRGDGWKKMMRELYGPKDKEGPGPANKAQWRNKRAQVISAPELLTGAPGSKVTAVVELKNGTNWPYKPGCKLQSYFEGKAADFLEPVLIPIEGVPEPMQQFKLTIPIQIRPSALVGQGEFVADFYAQGPNGWSFGEKISLKIKIEQAADIYDKAMELYAELSKTTTEDATLFDRIVEALQNCNGDAQAAKELINAINLSKQ